MLSAVVVLLLIYNTSKGEVLPRRPRQASGQRVDFLSFKVQDLEERLFREQLKVTQLEAQLSKLNQELSSLAQSISTPKVPVLKSQDTPAWNVIRADFDNIKESLVLEKSQRIRLEQAVEEIKENLKQKVKGDDLSDLRNTTRWLTSKIDVIEDRCLRVTKSNSSQGSDDKKPVPTEAANTETVGVQFDGKPLNDEDKRVANGMYIGLLTSYLYTSLDRYSSSGWQKTMIQCISYHFRLLNRFLCLAISLILTKSSFHLSKDRNIK